MNNLLPFIFSCSKIHTNQQIKEDTKSYKTSEKSFYLCWSVINVAVIVFKEKSNNMICFMFFNKKEFIWDKDKVLKSSKTSPFIVYH